MPRLHRSAAFLRMYWAAPHALLGRITRALATATAPRWAIDRVIARWIRRAAIDMHDFEAGPFPTLEAFFLRRLRPGARPIADGFVAPADGIVVGAGPIDHGTIVQVKGIDLDLARLTCGRGPALPLAAYEGGRYTTIFLTPDGYHHVHMPVAATVHELRWIPGRAFPQNHDALRTIPRIYERNERVTLRCTTDDGHDFLLIMVGASLIGGIHLDGLERAAWARRLPFHWRRSFARGERLGHFSFGSTVVLLVPPALAGPTPAIGEPLRMGQRLW
ncbi:MAG TPA: archaetidylserine decarboxylase [Nannocystis sp.]